MKVLLVGRTEAAAVLGIPIRALEHLLANGTIPSRKIGRRRLISKQILEDFVNKGWAMPGQEAAKTPAAPR